MDNTLTSLDSLIAAQFEEQPEVASPASQGSRSIVSNNTVEEVTADGHHQADEVQLAKDHVATIRLSKGLDGIDTDDLGANVSDLTAALRV